VEKCCAKKNVETFDLKLSLLTHTHIFILISGDGRKEINDTLRETEREKNCFSDQILLTFLTLNINTPRVRLNSMLGNMSRGNLYVSHFQVHYRAQCV
jgi:hypothetical protein